MIKNYTHRLDKLKDRRFDPLKKLGIYSKSFEKPEHSLALKYCFESMNEIDPTYTQATINAAEKVWKELLAKLPQKNIPVQFRYQGSVTTNNHIKLHSDIDVLALISKFYQVDYPITPEMVYKGNPLEDLRELRQETYNILSPIFQKIDATNPRAIQVQITNPDRKVDVVPCYWHYTNNYFATVGTDVDKEIHCGVQVFNFPENNVKEDYPFLHIHYVKSKGDRVDGFRKLVRLLKTLKADAESREISLSSFEITSLLYAIDDMLLIKPTDQQLLLLNEASNQLNILINVDSDIKKSANIYFNTNKLQQIQLETTGRSFPVFVIYDKSNKYTLRLYDMPTTLSGIEKAIEMYMRKGYIGKSSQQKLLEERELRNFQSTLQVLIDNDAYCREIVTIIPEK